MMKKKYRYLYNKLMKGRKMQNDEEYKLRVKMMKKKYRYLYNKLMKGRKIRMKKANYMVAKRAAIEESKLKKKSKPEGMNNESISTEQSNDSKSDNGTKA